MIRVISYYRPGVGDSHLRWFCENYPKDAPNACQRCGHEQATYAVRSSSCGPRFVGERCIGRESMDHERLEAGEQPLNAGVCAVVI